MTDEQRMLALKDGQMQEAGVLFEKWKIPIFHFFLRSCRDQMLAEDLTQNVFMRMIKYRNSYKEGSSFRTWIYQIARNIGRDELPKVQKTVNQVSEDIMDHSSLENAERDRKTTILYEVFLDLDLEERQILFMSRFEKMKYEEIGSVMDMTVSNIKIKVFRAMKTLKESYERIDKIR